jgi:hypothetical protein
MLLWFLGFILCWTLLIHIQPSESFSQSTRNEQKQRASCARRVDSENRRSFLQQFTKAATTSTSTAFILSQSWTPQSADAVMNVKQTVFKAGEMLTAEEAKKRFHQARQSLQYLLDHYDEICLGGGDNVRRYLGTVGTSSGLWGIGKVMRSLQEEADDLVEFTETMTDVEASIQQADGSAYMAIFVTTSTSGTPPEKYFKDALIEAQRAAKGMDKMASLLKDEINEKIPDVR